MTRPRQRGQRPPIAAGPPNPEARTYPTPRPFHLIPTDHAQRMAAAKTLDEGREIIADHGLAVWEAQCYAGWHTRDHPDEHWLVGPMPWGARGFEVLNKADLRRLAGLSLLCGVLVDVGRRMGEEWHKLYVQGDSFHHHFWGSSPSSRLRAFIAAFDRLHEQHPGVKMYFSYDARLAGHGADLAVAFGDDAAVALIEGGEGGPVRCRTRGAVRYAEWDRADDKAVVGLLAKAGRKYLLFHPEQLPPFPAGE